MNDDNVIYVQVEVNRSVTPENFDRPIYISQVIWLPKEYAKLGARVRLKNSFTKEWYKESWAISWVGLLEVKGSQLFDSHIDIKAHRDNTGDSMPKRKVKV